MTLGNEGRAILIAEDDEMVIYEYKAIKWCCPRVSRFEMVKPGYFYIKKSCFQEPEIHTKIKRREKSRRKYIAVKRIHVFVDCDEYIENGDIIIERGTPYEVDSIWSDRYVVNYLLYKIFDLYQDRSQIPEYVHIVN